MSSLHGIVDLVLAVGSLPAVVAAAYLGLLTVCSGRLRERTLPSRAQLPFFQVIIPAHDEEDGIAATVASVFGVDYPRDRYCVQVVADNCTDATADRARSAGADVLERCNPVARGKGHALTEAFAAAVGRGRADAVVVVDADTRVSRELLHAFAGAMEAGALAMQGDYRVRNASASWRTRLMVIALATFHTLRSLARERLGLSTGLRGNGMALSCRMLRQVRSDAASVVEDVELGISLGKAGHRVVFVPEAVVWGDMAASSTAARSQRQRWEGGRRALARLHAWSLIRQGIRRRDRVAFDLGVDLVVPPLGALAAYVVAGLVAAVLLTSYAWLGWALSAFLLAAYVARGAQLGEVGPRAIFDLAWAPVYVAWKMAVPRRAPSTWVRTTRENTK